MSKFSSSSVMFFVTKLNVRSFYLLMHTYYSIEGTHLKVFIIISLQPPFVTNMHRGIYFRTYMLKHPRPYLNSNCII